MKCQESLNLRDFQVSFLFPLIISLALEQVAILPCCVLYRRCVAGLVFGGPATPVLLTLQAGLWAALVLACRARGEATGNGVNKALASRRTIV